MRFAGRRHNSAIFEVGRLGRDRFRNSVNMVKIVVAAAKGGGKLAQRPWLGATLHLFSKEIADNLGLERASGGAARRNRPKGPAAEAGLERGRRDHFCRRAGGDDPKSVGYRLATKPRWRASSLGVIRGSKKMSTSMRLRCGGNAARDPVKIGGQTSSWRDVINLSPAVIEGEMSVQGATSGVVGQRYRGWLARAAIGPAKGRCDRRHQ